MLCHENELRHQREAGHGQSGHIIRHNPAKGKSRLHVSSLQPGLTTRMHGLWSALQFYPIRIRMYGSWQQFIRDPWSRSQRSSVRGWSFEVRIKIPAQTGWKHEPHLAASLRLALSIPSSCKGRLAAWKRVYSFLSPLSTRCSSDHHIVRFHPCHH